MEKALEQEHPVKAFGWAARDASGYLSPFSFSRRPRGDEDVRFKVLYCGMCHTDLHNIKNEWGISMYPMVPGHEIVGEVTEVGSKVNKVKIGDKVGVGCMVGYSDTMVANERYIVHFPENLPLDAGAPLLCAGITVYSPLRYFGLSEPGKHVGIVGLGGLGHTGVKFAKAFGSKAAIGTLDGIIDTVSAAHPIVPLLGLLKPHGKLILVGVPEKSLDLHVFPLIMGRKSVAGSGIGGMKETQEMIDFAAKHNITAEVEVNSMDYVNTTMERLAKNDVR
ncbi:hypothetical protein TB2_018581 [Malus domestica]